jgi:hypothetical protein
LDNTAGKFFVENLIDHVVGGIIAALEGVAEPRLVGLAINQDTVDLRVNEAQVPTNAFVSKVITRTVFALANCLKGVGQIEDLRIDIRR